ncbi:MAG: methylmalonyl-CoA carboxyltransferase [Solirubrobacterales bacterium]|nr:methylmalonyl-CoA carboxyltransferase [Solirubrobacterales bacterium]
MSTAERKTGLTPAAPEQAVPAAVTATPDPALLRLARVCDPGTFKPLRSNVGDGVLAGSGRVMGRPVYVWAQQISHMGGSLGTEGGRTIARVIRMAAGSRAPVIGFPASGGARLQEGIAALNAYGSIFRAQVLAEVPQISVISGPCAGGAAYSPALGDFTIMAGDNSQMFLTGPKVVERVMRESVTLDELGGSRVHRANGVAHLVAEDEAEGARMARALIGYLPQIAKGPLPIEAPIAPNGGDPSGPVPSESRKVYDVCEVIERIVDLDSFMEVAPRWARNMVCGFGRLEGHPVGVIANQPAYLGGTIDSSASEKGAWFVDLCNRFGLPLAVLVDTTGFLPGTRQEHAGVIRHGASLVRAFAGATVPRATVVLRQAFGGAHIAMNSRDLGATVSLAWDGARIGVMGARQAVEIIDHRAISDGADPELLAEAYEERHLSAAQAAAAGEIDEMIAPSETRERLVAALGAWA